MEKILLVIGLAALLGAGVYMLNYESFDPRDTSGISDI